MRLFCKYLKIHLKSQMQYRISFLLITMTQFIVAFSSLASVFFLMNRFHEVNGFTFQEVLLCFAAILMAFSLSECFARGFDRFNTVISNGTFDRIMVRPRNIILQVLGSQIEFSRLGRLVQAIIVFCYAIPSCGVVWTPDKILLLALMVLSGVVVFSGLFIIHAALCFFTTEGLEFISIFTDGGREIGSYPISIYGDAIMKIFTYVVPLSLVQYYPFLYLTDRSSNPWLFALPLIACLFLIPCLLLWRFGVRHYRSTGS